MSVVSILTVIGKTDGEDNGLILCRAYASRQDAIHSAFHFAEELGVCQDFNRDFEVDDVIDNDRYLISVSDSKVYDTRILP